MAKVSSAGSHIVFGGPVSSFPHSGTLLSLSLIFMTLILLKNLHQLLLESPSIWLCPIFLCNHAGCVSLSWAPWWQSILTASHHLAPFWLVPSLMMLNRITGWKRTSLGHHFNHHVSLPGAKWTWLLQLHFCFPQIPGRMSPVFHTSSELCRERTMGP